MNRLTTLTHAVATLYDAKDTKRTDWADWLWKRHVPVVVEQARILAERFGADTELAEAAAWLHDIADVKMNRAAQGHREESLRMARELLESAGYNAKEIALVVDDALAKHGCRQGVEPDSLEGRVLATADALAHLCTDFYIFASWAKGGEGESLEAVREYGAKKSARDFMDKICFDEVREEVRPTYNFVQRLFAA